MLAQNKFIEKRGETGSSVALWIVAAWLLPEKRGETGSSVAWWIKVEILAEET